VLTVPAGGGQPKRLTYTNDNSTPSYSRDGRWIYYSSRREGKLQIWRIPADGGPEQLVVASNGGLVPLESADGKTIYYCHDLPAKGIWMAPVEGGSAQQVTGTYARPICGIAMGRETLYYAAPPDSQGRYSVQALELATRRARPVVEAAIPIGAGLGLGVSPDERVLLAVQEDQSGSDLMVVKDFKTH
jgi:hypothetical protein